MNRDQLQTEIFNKLQVFNPRMAWQFNRIASTNLDSDPVWNEDKQTAYLAFADGTIAFTPFKQ